MKGLEPLALEIESADTVPVENAGMEIRKNDGPIRELCPEIGAFQLHHEKKTHFLPFHIQSNGRFDGMD